jgi:hypothetical protein
MRQRAFSLRQHKGIIIASLTAVNLVAPLQICHVLQTALDERVGSHGQEGGS